MYPVPGSTPPRAPGGASLLSPSGSRGRRSACHVFCGIDDVQLQKCKNPSRHVLKNIPRYISSSILRRRSTLGAHMTYRDTKQHLHERAHRHVHGHTCKQRGRGG